MDGSERNGLDLKQKIAEKAGELAGEITGLAKTLYDNPETAYEERNSCRLLAGFLDEHGFETQIGAGGVETAFVARPKGAKPKEPLIAFLAEYDALPKIGHGCGHNLIAGGCMGAAVSLVQTWPEIAGSVMVVGTPAEEGGGGKALLADAGVFEGVSAAFMFHPGQFNHLGTDSLGRIKAKVEFFGKSSHAASSPEQGLNALDALVGAYNNVSAMRQQMPPDARIHGVITHGGEAPNVIPDYTAMLYYIRAMDKDYLGELFKKFEACCQGAALAAGCRCEVTVQPPSLDPMKRNLTLEEAWRQNMEILGVEPDYTPSGIGSTDLGNLSQLMPVIQPFLTICGTDTAFHTLEFAQATQSQQGNQALVNAAKLLAMTASDYLASQELQQAAAEEFAGK